MEKRDSVDDMNGLELSLEGKVVLVTGGSRGIGRATVELLHKAGARVAFNYLRAQAQAEEVVAMCGGAEWCRAFQQELLMPADGRKLVAEVVAAFGRLDALVVNHGIWPPQDVGISAMTDEQWHRTIAVNLDSAFGLVQAAVKQMEQQGRPAHGAAAGHVVLVSSTAGQRGEAFHADYAASKGALISMTKGLGTELAPKGIYVNCVAPGWVMTEMSAPALADAGTREKIFGAIPLGRVADPVEVAGPIVFLCTPYAGFMTGEIVNVNGGAVLVG